MDRRIDLMDRLDGKMEIFDGEMDRLYTYVHYIYTCKDEIECTGHTHTPPPPLTHTSSV